MTGSSIDAKTTAPIWMLGGVLTAIVAATFFLATMNTKVGELVDDMGQVKTAVDELRKEWGTMAVLKVRLDAVDARLKTIEATHNGAHKDSGR